MTEEKYRKLKAKLNRVTKFGFKMPRKGRAFTPQQKSAITRAEKRYGKLARKLQDKTATIIRRKPPKEIAADFHKTPKGYIYTHGPKEKARIRNKRVHLEGVGASRLYLPYTVEDGDFDTWAAAMLESHRRYGYTHVNVSTAGHPGNFAYSHSQISRLSYVTGTNSHGENYSDFIDGIWLIKRKRKNAKQIT